MNKKKKYLLLMALVIGCILAIIALLAIVAHFSFFHSAHLNNQKLFLQDNGYLLGDKEAIKSYLEAIKVLKDNGITDQTIKDLSPEPLFAEGIIRNVFPDFKEGAKQKEFGMPWMSYYGSGVPINNETISANDIYLCGSYLISLIESDYPADERESALVCLSFGVQLSAYKYRSHDALYSGAIACKWKALQKLMDLYRQKGDQEELAKVKMIFQEVEQEFQDFKRKVKEREPLF